MTVLGHSGRTDTLGELPACPLSSDCYRIGASQQSGASCHEATYAVQQARPLSRSCLAIALAGRRTVKIEPLPISLVTVTSPPIMRASLRERARPSPVPP